MIWMLLAVLFCQILRGIAEGITMFQPGPRLHSWFRWYHLADFGAMVMLTATVYSVTKSFPGWLFLGGTLVLGWEAFEAAYLWARRGQATGHENILGLWAFDGSIWWLHTARILIGAALLIGGWQ